MVASLLFSCGWIRTTENNDDQGKMLGIFWGVYEKTFIDHVGKIEEGTRDDASENL